MVLSLWPKPILVCYTQSKCQLHAYKHLIWCQHPGSQNSRFRSFFHFELNMPVSPHTPPPSLSLDTEFTVLILYCQTPSQIQMLQEIKKFFQSKQFCDHIWALSICIRKPSEYTNKWHLHCPKCFKSNHQSIAINMD